MRTYMCDLLILLAPGSKRVTWHPLFVLRSWVVGICTCPISIFKFSIKNNFSTQTLAPPKNHIKIFKNQKSNAASQTPIQYTTFHQYSSFTKYLCLLRCGGISTSTPHFFCTAKFDLFDLRNPKIQIWQIISSRIIPKMNQKSPKDPKLILILTIKLL